MYLPVLKALLKTFIHFDIYLGRLKHKIGLHTTFIIVIIGGDIITYLYLGSAKTEGLS